MTASIVHIVAFTKTDKVIGINNKLPFTLSDDLKRFSSLTQDQLICMGFNTFKDIYDNHTKDKTKFLSGRKSIVVCYNNKDHHTSVEDLQRKYGTDTLNFITEKELRTVLSYSNTPVIIIGGSKLYQEFKPTVVLATIVDTAIDSSDTVLDPTSEDSTQDIVTYPHSLDDSLSFDLDGTLNCVDKVSGETLTYTNELFVLNSN